MRLLALLAALACCAALAAGAAGAAGDPYAALLAPPGRCADADAVGLPAAAARRAMLCLSNYARTRSGLAPLRLDEALSAAGDAKLAADVSCGEFSHTPCGKPFESVFAGYLAGASGFAIGENIAWGSGSYGTPRKTMDRWLHSTGHRANLLNARFVDLGVGYLPAQRFQGRDGVTLWSQELGARDARASTRPLFRVRRDGRRPADAPSL